MRRAAETTCGLLLAGAACESVAGRAALAAPADPETGPRECMFYARLDGRDVQCQLCPHGCRLPDGERGLCRVRVNRGGIFRTLAHNRVCSLNVDPIEKKPFYHYLPGTAALSIATAGCNMSCRFCQNWQISQSRPEDLRHRDATAQQLVELAVQRNIPTIAYTYNEPVIFTEYVHDVARLGRTRSVGSVIISNGFINETPMRELTRHLTAVKVDLKAFTEKFYRDVCGASLQPVLDNLKVLRSTGIHLEIVVLLIPTLNDDADETRRMCDWIVRNLGPDVPVHFSRFHPSYKMMNLPPTPVKTVERAREIAVKQGIHYAYVGNVPLHDYGHTTCHKCGTLLIERAGYRLAKVALVDGKCPKCDAAIPGVWSEKQALAFKPKPKET